LRLAFVGNLIPRKGALTVLHAVAQLPPEIWRLSVLGNMGVDAAHTAALRRYAAQAGLSERVTWHGAVSDDALETVLADSHVLVVPSTYEGFGIVYLEGMGFGLPAIASTAGAAHEIITPGVDGFLIAPGDAKTLAQHLRALHADRALLARMGVRALERFGRQPGWGEAMGTVRDFLRRWGEHGWRRFA
jgi:glycosyltransferase involved in cell wall biosynthesis